MAGLQTWRREKPERLVAASSIWVREDTLRFGYKAGICLVFAALVPLGAVGAATVAPDNVRMADGVVETSLSGAPGDAAAGKKWFINRKLGNCLACHVNQDAASQPFHGEVGHPVERRPDLAMEWLARRVAIYMAGQAIAELAVDEPFLTRRRVSWSPGQ